MGVMDDAIEDGVSEGRLADQIVPVVDWHLAEPKGRAHQLLPTAVLLLPDLQDADLGVGNFAVEFAFRHR